MRKSLAFNLVGVMVFALLFIQLGVNVSSAQTADCVVPESGPWPACATAGGGATTAAQTGGATATASQDCVIPTSGPWPPCATSGAATTSAPAAAASNGGAADGCVIPTSGPWPPCAFGGRSSGQIVSAPSAPAQTAPPSSSGSGTTSSAAGSRVFNMQQVRSMMVGIMNETFTGNASCTGNQCFGNETEVTIENGTIRMVAFSTPSGSAARVKIDLLMRVSAENGEAKLTLVRLTRNGVVPTGADELASLSMRASTLFDQRLDQELNASSYSSIMAADSRVTVAYR